MTAAGRPEPEGAAAAAARQGDREGAAGPRGRPEDERPGDRPEGGPALELLVHGVGGTTPQEMLGDPHTVRITGDETAAVHRRADDADAELHPERHRGRAVPEAYSWSNLTSGNSARALWLLLLPFMVANLAHWTRPAARGRPAALRVHGALVRLVALSLTVLFTAAACEVALDLVAWQCAGTGDCSRSRSWLGFLSAERGGWWSAPGRRLALAAVVPAALTGLLWWLSRRTWSAYESQAPHRPAPSGHAPEETGRPALSLPGFWYGRRLVARLRAAHTAAGLLTVAAALSAAAARYDRGPGGGGPLEFLGRALDGALAAGGLAVLWVVAARGRSESEPDDRADRAVVRALPGAALGLLALAVLHAAWTRPGWTSSGPLPGHEGFTVLPALQGLLVLGIAVAGRLLHRAAPDRRTALRGFAGAAVATLACAVGGLMSGGVAQRIADWLDRQGTPGAAGGTLAGPPVVLSWQAAALPLLLAALLVPAGHAVWRTRRIRRREIAVCLAEYPQARPEDVRARRIAGTVARARLTDCIPWFVGAAAALTFLLGGAAVAGAAATGEVPGRAADGAPDAVEALAETCQALGSWLTGVGVLLLVAWGRRAYRDASARRTVGILWDVGTFWPRAAHPFAPPCYAERAVPDLTWRMDTWTAATGGRLVISGHSQGSVLAAAAVWQLDRSTRRRVALLTYGSPLERLYGRWFPAYFGPEQLGALHREVRCWRNLWRRTDPIGGPVRLPEEAGPEVDRAPLRDPLAYDRTVRYPLPEPILGHSEYQAHPAFSEERAGLLRRLPGGVPRPRTARAAPAAPGPGEAAAPAEGRDPA